MSVKLGLPSKGRILAETIDWFAGLGIAISPAEGGREYTGEVGGIDGVELVFLSAGEIPRELASGRIHLGLTGRDLIEERLPGHTVQLQSLATPGFAHADLVLAVPDAWVDVCTLDDLDAAAAGFRETHGFRLRIATKYHNLTRRFLAQNDVADYQLVDSQGATEGTVRNLTAEAIADITSTGTTLTANHLRPLDDGLILRSEATLYRSLTAPVDGAMEDTLSRLVARVA